MAGRFGIRSFDKASVPALVWSLAALAALAVAIQISHSNFSLVSVLTLTAPFVFAAAVAYVEPDDPRFLQGSLLIAANAAVFIGTSLVRDAIAFYFPILVYLAGLLRMIAPILLIGGLVLFGIALGGVRTRSAGRATAGTAVLLAGIAVAAGQVIWFATHPLPGEIPLEINLSAWIAPAAYAVAHAFLAASAIDARRTLLAVGSGLLFVGVLIDFALLVMQPGPDTYLPLLSWVGMIPVAAWAALIGGVLAGEIAGRRRLFVDQPVSRPTEV